MGFVTRTVGHADFICAWHFRIRVFDTSEIGHARRCVQIFEHRVAACAVAETGDLALRIGDIAEHDRIIRTSLLASDLERSDRRFAGRCWARFHKAGDLGLLDTLDAERAFFHDAAHTNSDVRIFCHLEAVCHAFFGKRTPIKFVDRALVVVEIVKAANFPWAVIRAIAGADATIVGHEIETILAVHGRIHGTNGFARGVFAMLAHHSLRKHFRILNITRKISIQTDPSHVTIFANLVFSDHRHVVFGLAGNDAGIATRAGIEIHRHSPLLFRGECRMGVERNIRRDVTIHAHRLGKGIVFLEALECSLANEVTTFHAAMLLGLRERVIPIGHNTSDTACEAHCFCSAHRIGVEADVFHEGGNVFASVAERNGERVIGVTGSYESSGFNRSLAIADLHDVRDEIVVDFVAHFFGNLFERTEVIGLDSEFLRGSWADHDRVVPSHFRNKIGSFNEPGIVGVASVIDASALKEYQFQRIRSAGFCSLGGERTSAADVQCGLHRRKGGTRQESIAKKGIPRFV